MEQGRTLGKGRFYLLWASCAVSNLGDGVQLAAFPLLASVVTQDPLQIGFIAAARGVPILLLSPVAGICADRFNRAKITILSNVVRLMVMLYLLFCVCVGQLAYPDLVVGALLSAIGEVFYDNSSSSILPRIVEKQDLPKANSLFYITSYITNGLAGPSLGGLIFSMGYSIPVWVSIVTIALSSLFLLLMVKSFTVSFVASRSALETDSVWSGFVFCVKDPRIRYVLLLTAGWNFFGWIPEGVLVYFVKETLGQPDVVFGFILSVTSLGAVLGGLISPFIIKAIGIHRVLVYGMLLYGVLFVLVGFCQSVPLITFMFFIQGLPLVSWSVASTTVRQSVTPDNMLGRVNSVFYLLSAGLAPLAMLVGAFLSDLMEMKYVFMVSGLGVVMTCIVAKLVSVDSSRFGIDAFNKR